MKTLNEYINSQQSLDFINEGWLGKLIGNIFGGANKAKEVIKDYTNSEKASLKAILKEIEETKDKKAIEALKNIQNAKGEKKTQLEDLMKNIEEFSQDDDTKNTGAFASLVVHANELAKDLKDNDSIKKLQEYAKSTDSKTQSKLKEILKEIQQVEQDNVNGDKNESPIDKENVENIEQTIETPAKDLGVNTEKVVTALTKLFGESQEVNESLTTKQKQLFNKDNDPDNKRKEALALILTGIQGLSNMTGASIDVVIKFINTAINDNEVKNSLK